MTLDERTLAAIELADTDALLRSVDAMAGRRAWDELVSLRLHLAAAIERGRQLWGVDEHIRYRFALEAPAGLAVPAVLEGPARFTLGPLTEVIAQNNTFAELDPHLGPGSDRVVIAHERAIRGDSAATIEDGVFDIPLRRPWEPRYAVPVYRSDRADFPTPPTGDGGEAVTLPDPVRRIEDEPTEDALLALVTPWTTMSNGVTDLAMVEGGALEAIAALGVRRVTARRVAGTEAMAWMAWTAASGGAHGRRRGGAAGRFLAWSAVAALAGLDWPADPEEVRRATSALEWWLWDDGSATGWSLKMAVHDPADRLAWAFAAVDARSDTPDEG